MRVLIIEDEKPAAQHLAALLHRYDATIEIYGPLKTVAQAKKWFADPPHELDMIFMDIQLADGSSFDILEHISMQQPIIFTTAFHQYALEAFRTNGIAYLLKPITLTQLSESMEKWKRLQQPKPPMGVSAEQMQLLAKVLQQAQAEVSYKQRFMVKLGERIRSIEVGHIAFFYAEGRTVFLITLLKEKYVVDYTMEQLESVLAPATFFRINRSFFVHIRAITEVLVHSNSRLKVLCSPASEKEMIVSREKVAAFKEWFDNAPSSGANF